MLDCLVIGADRQVCSQLSISAGIAELFRLSTLAKAGLRRFRKVISTQGSLELAEKNFCVD